jgi:hypothetical protein
MSIAQALDAVVDLLTEAGLQATRDAGSFYPNTVACLVGMPTVKASGLAYRTMEVPIHVVTSDPPSLRSVDQLYAAAEIAAAALETDTYAPQTWSGGPNADALPSILINAVVSFETTESET